MIKPILVHPLNDLKTDSLYRLLGDAWIAHLHPEASGSQHHQDAPEVGKREFDALLPLLRDSLNRPYRHGVVACVANTIHRHGTWAMPENVTAVLAVRLGLVATRPTPDELQADALELIGSPPDQSSSS